jgi:hypothetical protein
LRIRLQSVTLIAAVRSCAGKRNSAAVKHDQLLVAMRGRSSKSSRSSVM